MVACSDLWHFTTAACGGGNSHLVRDGLASGGLIVASECIVTRIQQSVLLTLSQEGIQPQGWALQDVSNDSFVCYQDLSEYVGL